MVACYYKTGMFVSQYLKPLIKKEFLINSTHDFLSLLNIILIPEDKEGVSYVVVSLFTNIPIKDTIDFICEICKKCAKHLFKKLL